MPTASAWVTGNENRAARTVAESALFVSLFVAFSYWVFGSRGLGSWIGYAAALTLILEIGSRLVERYVQATLNRIIRNVSYRDLMTDARSVEKMFRGELVLYLPVPAGLVIGTVVALLENWGPSAALRFSIELVLALASLVLLFFLITAFARMTDALFREDAVSSVSLAEGPVRSGALGSLGKIFRFFVPSPQVDQDGQEQKDLSLAYMISDLRKAYLYDSAHNVILLVSFAFIMAAMSKISIGIQWVVLALVGLGFIFGQLPYIIGQSLLHEKILDRYEGVKRAEVAEQLRKNAPLFPTVYFLAALFTTGTAGGLLYFLMDQFLRNALK